MSINPPDPAVATAIRAIGVAADMYGPTLNTAGSPAAVETIGRALADALREHRPDALLVWNTIDERVLAHVIGRELDTSVLYAGELEGIVTLRPGVASGTRVALVATAWEDARRLATLRALAGTEHTEVVAVAAVLQTPAQRAVEDLPIVHVATAPEGGPA